LYRYDKGAGGYGSGGYGGGSRGGGFGGGGDRMSNLGAGLKVQQWDMNTLPKFEKSFCRFPVPGLVSKFSRLTPSDKEAPSVAARTPPEVEAFRAEKQMRIQGTDVPKPIVTFDEAGFPSTMCSNHIYNM
jgi:ATP-dependent RNA helicase DDX5/DBP2